MVIKKKVVIVGDDTSGKTSLLNVFSKGKFPEKYIPTTWEDYRAPIQVDGEEMQLALSDTAGDESYDRLRPPLYRDSDVVIICFSISSPQSLQNVLEKWKPEARHFCPYIPIILVGNKVDLRNDDQIIQQLRQSNQEMVTRELGQVMASRINAFAYLECSAKSGYGITQLFETATRASCQRVNSPTTSPVFDSRPTSSTRVTFPNAGSSQGFSEDDTDTRRLINTDVDLEGGGALRMSQNILHNKGGMMAAIIGLLNCVLVTVLILIQLGVISK